MAEFTRQYAQVNGGDPTLQNLIGEVAADRKVYEKYLARFDELHSTVADRRPDASFL